MPGDPIYSTTKGAVEGSTRAALMAPAETRRINIQAEEERRTTSMERRADAELYATRNAIAKQAWYTSYYRGPSEEEVARERDRLIHSSEESECTCCKPMCNLL